METPSKTTKLFFWLILAAYSTFFAEVIAGSDPFPFFHLWGVLVVCPLYGLHTLILATLVFRHGRPWFHTLFAAGILFGLYEAYITKVLWAPPWTEDPVLIAGIAAPEFAVLALFWHPILAFFVPLLVGEGLLTGSRAIYAGLSERIRRWIGTPARARVALAALTMTMAITLTGNAASPSHTLLSTISTTGVLFLLTFLWRKVARGTRYSLEALLPNPREWSVLAVLLALLYILALPTLRPEALPGPGPQAVMWAIYLAAIIFFAQWLRRSRNASLPADSFPLSFSWRWLVALIALFCVTATAAKIVLAQLTEAVLVLVWLGGGGMGLITLVSAALALVRRRSTPQLAIKPIAVAEVS